MSNQKPYEFRDDKEIIQSLSKTKSALRKWFDQRIPTLDEITHRVASGNTFRAFSHMPQKPSVVCRTWASAEFQSQKVISELRRMSSQPQYDKWIKEFSGRLSRTWRKQMGTSMPYGPGRKLPNLLLKHFALWAKLDDVQRDNLLNYLHVPLDNFTLVGIRNCIEDYKIPKNATMRFVDGETMYDQIQQAIRNVAQSAEVPAIFFDVLAWDVSHQVL
jgi:hypothetical protein